MRKNSLTAFALSLLTVACTSFPDTFVNKSNLNAAKSGFSIKALPANDVITFDSDMNVEGYAPVDNQPLSNDFMTSHGVSFRLENSTDSFPFLENVGGERPSGFSRTLQAGETCDGAYQNGSECHDTAAPGFEEQLGDFFIRMNAKDGAKLVIDYQFPVAQASFEIWDMDSHPTFGSERWRIEVFDIQGSLVNSFLTDDGLDVFLDGQPYRVVVIETAPVISQIKVSFAGTKDRGLGLAFNNFSPSTAGVPIVGLDLKPGSNPSAVNLKKKGSTPAAIFGEPDFDVTQIDPSTLLLDGGESTIVRMRGKRYQVSYKDLNGDELTDMVVQFENGSLNLNGGDATLFGLLYDGSPFYAFQDGDSDPVKVIG